MARKKAAFIFCDNPDCKVSIEVDEDAGTILDNWFQLKVGHDGRYSQDNWEFCSAKCLGTWAKYRGRADNGEPLKRSTPLSETKAELKEQNDKVIWEVFETGDEFLVSEIVDLTGLNRTSIQNRVDEYLSNNLIFQTQERRGPNGAKYRINA